MKRRKTLVRAVALFMVGLITALALVIPTSAIMTEYPTLDNYTTYDCVMPFNVNFIGTDGTLDYVYSVPVGYNSPTEQTGIQGHDTLTGRVLGGDGITTNNATLEYYYYPSEWRNVNEDGWGGVPVKLRIDNTELDGKTIVIEAPTFYVNPLTSNWYYSSDPTTYNKWAMGAFRMPTLEDPTTQAYVGRYTVYANIVDDVGTRHPVAYSKSFDTRVNNNWIPFLEPSIFQEYVINDIQETGYNRIVAVTDFRAFVDYDYYEYVIPDRHVTISVNGVNATFPIPDGATVWSYMNNVYNDNGLVDGYRWRIYTSGQSMYLTNDDEITLATGEISYIDGDSLTSLDNISTNPIYKCYPEQVGGSPELITFTIDGTSYTAYVGMSWYEWCHSDYNTTDYSTNNDAGTYVYRSDGAYAYYICTQSGVLNSRVYGTDIITSTSYYSIRYTGGDGNDVGFGGDESPGAFDDDFDWGGALDEPPSATVYDVTPTADDGTWELVENSPLKATGIDVSYPVYERDFEVGDLNLGYPDFNRYILKFRGIGNIDVNADFTGWIATATSGFLNFELLPNFSIGGVLAILVGFSLVILFLKIFAGG